MSLENRTDGEVEQLLTSEPETCVYVAPNATNIKVEGYRLFEEGPCPYRRIQTARTPEAINEAINAGFWPLVKKVEPSPEITGKVEIYQNQQTGEVKIVGNSRQIPARPWKKIIKLFAYYPYSFPSPIAAYLVPPDLHEGERVFLTDVIEDFVALQEVQGYTYRLESAYAIWDGKRFLIDWDEERDRKLWLG